MRFPITTSALLAFLCLVAVAQAAVVHEVTVELRDEKPYGAATLRVTEKIYDTSGAVHVMAPSSGSPGSVWSPSVQTIGPRRWR